MEILRFDDLYKAAKIEFMQAFLLEKLPPSFDNVWVTNLVSKSVVLRNSTEMFVPPPRLEFSGRLPLHDIPKTYNELNNLSLKNNVSLDSFKDGLKAHFLNNLLDVVYCGRPFCKDCFPDQI